MDGIGFNSARINNLDLKGLENNLVINYLKDKTQYLGGNVGDSLTSENVFEFIGSHIDGVGENNKADSNIDDKEVKAWFEDNKDVVTEFAKKMGYSSMDAFINDFTSSLKKIVDSKTIADNYLDFSYGLSDSSEDQNTFDINQFNLSDKNESLSKSYLNIAQDIIGRYDTDGSEGLDYNEFVKSEIDAFSVAEFKFMDGINAATMEELKGDGNVDKDEFKTLLDDDATFKAIDKNNNNVLSSEEYLQYKNESSFNTVKESEIFKNTFKNVDLDGDQKISAKERAAALMFLDRADNTYDGKISHDNINSVDLSDDFWRKDIEKSYKEAFGETEKND